MESLTNGLMATRYPTRDRIRQIRRANSWGSKCQPSPVASSRARTSSTRSYRPIPPKSVADGPIFQKVTPVSGVLPSLSQGSLVHATSEAVPGRCHSENRLIRPEIAMTPLECSPAARRGRQSQRFLSLSLSLLRASLFLGKTMTSRRPVTRRGSCTTQANPSTNGTS